MKRCIFCGNPKEKWLSDIRIMVEGNVLIDCTVCRKCRKTYHIQAIYDRIKENLRIQGEKAKQE